MADVRSKNLYELLGNDPELDSDREPEPPTQAVEKPAPRHGKRDAPKEVPAAAAAAPPTAPRGGARGGRGGRVGGNEEAFRDRQAGSYNNRSRPVDEHKDAQRRGIRARDDRGARVRNDRHSRTGHTDTNKQVDQGWGATHGDSEWNDEKAGEAIARTDANEPQTPGEGEPAAVEEPQDKAKSYDQYLAELAEKRREDLGVKAARAPNEGAKGDKKWETAKEIKRGEEEEAYIKGKEEKEKAKRERQRKEKTFVDVDMRFVEPSSRGRGNGPRGRGDGPRGRGDGPRGRGGRGGRGGRPEGGRPEGARGGGRGVPAAAAAASTPAVTVDEKNFPSLGGK